MVIIKYLQVSIIHTIGCINKLFVSMDDTNGHTYDLDNNIIIEKSFWKEK